MSTAATTLAAPSERASKTMRIACLCGLLLVFIAFRLALLEWSFAALFTPGYEVFPMGTLASELVTGLPSLPIFEFHDTHSGGQILSSLLTAVSFKLFGATYWAVKIVPVFFAALTLAFLFLFFERWYGLMAALLGSALWIVGPATYVDYSTSNYGNHSEVLAFVALTLFPLWRRFVDGNTSAKTYALLGLTCGLAIWYSLSSLLLLVLYLVVWFVVERDFFRKIGFAWFMGGVTVGMLPVWYVMATYEAPQAEWMGNKFGAEAAGLASTQALARLWDFWSRLWFESPQFYSISRIDGAMLSTVYAVFWLLAMVWLAWMARGVISRGVKRALFLTREPIDGHAAVVLALVAYPLALGMAYAGSNFKIGNWIGYEWAGYRYCITGFFVLNVLFVVCWRELRARGRAAIANGLIGVVLAIGVIGNAGHPFSTIGAGMGRKYDGFDYIHMGRLFLVDRWEHRRPEEVFAVLAGLEPWKRHEVLQGIGYVRALPGLRDDPNAKPVVFAPTSFLRPWTVAAVPRGCAPALAEGAGMMLAWFHRATQKRVVESLEAYRGPERRFFVHGCFVPGEFVDTAEVKRRTAMNLRLVRLLKDPAIRSFAVEGLGKFAGGTAWRALAQEDVYIQQIFDFANTLPKGEQESFMLGFGMSCARYFSNPTRYDQIMTRWVQPAGLGTAYCGIGMVADLVWQEHWRDLVKDATPQLTQYRDHVARGVAWRDEEPKRKQQKAAAPVPDAKAVPEPGPETLSADSKK